MSDSDEGETTVRLSERREPRSGETTVECPMCFEPRAVTFCRNCPRFERELTNGEEYFLECRVPVAATDHQGLCAELMSPETTCLDSELDAATASEFLEIEGITSAPVLDDNFVLVGVVSSTSLARLRQECGDCQEVEDAMTTEVVTLPQQATVGQAARLMASRGIDRVPIVTDDGHLVGVISAMDVVRWLAKRLG